MVVVDADILSGKVERHVENVVIWEEVLGGRFEVFERWMTMDEGRAQLRDSHLSLCSSPSLGVHKCRREAFASGAGTATRIQGLLALTCSP
jgi:hypothetical protein